MPDRDPPPRAHGPQRAPLLLEAARAVAATRAEDEVLAAVLSALQGAFAPRGWAVDLVDAAGDLVVQAAGGEGLEALEGRRFPAAEGLAGACSAGRAPLLVADPRSDGRFSPRVDPAPPGEGCPVLLAPMRDGGRSLGVLAVAGPRGDAAEALADLACLAQLAALALANARAFARMRELALVDEHTGLYNVRHLSRALSAEVGRASRFRRALSVVFLDLDRFKAVNDAHGHQAGSALLREVAERLRAGLRAMDVPVRYGGDEFVVLLPETGREAARAVAERLRRTLAEAPFLGARALEVRVTASFGVATWPEDGATPDALLHAADVAMYRAKGAGRDQVAAAGA